jgi:hypothetical protein
MNFLIRPSAAELEDCGDVFPDSLRDLVLAQVMGSKILTKLPRFVERVEMTFHIETAVRLIPVSVLPSTLRTFKIGSTRFEPVIQLDAPFPPHLEVWYAKTNWQNLPPNFTLPNTLESVNCPMDMFGPDFEAIPKSLTSLYADEPLEESQIKNLPSSLSELFCEYFATSPALSMLPRTLSVLELSDCDADILTKSVCERLESLDRLVCCLRHFESLSCFSTFKRLKTLHILVDSIVWTEEEAFFSQFSNSCKNSTEELRIDIVIHLPGKCVWPLWISQLKDFPNLLHLYCALQILCGNDRVPEYLKCLPPKLRFLHIPPMAPKSFPRQGLQMLPKQFD